MKTLRLLIFFVLLPLSACTTIPVDERTDIRDEINNDMDETIARMVDDDSELQKNIDDIISVMKAKLGSSIYGARSIQLITSLYDSRGNQISSRSRM